MGTFLGHALPGTFFVMFAAWWLTQLTRRYIICRQRGLLFTNTASYPLLWGAAANWPMEGIVKLTVTGVGMIGELIAATNYGRARSFVFLGDLQHVTMYAFFALSGIVDICTQRGCRCVPPGLDYVAGALAFIGEALLFTLHLHGRSPVDVVLHKLLVAAVVSCVLTTLLECRLRCQPLIAFLRVYCVGLQGAWFWQVGFILYSPHPLFRPFMYGIYSNTDDSSISAAGVVFIWHCFGVVVAMVIVSSVTAVVVNYGCEQQQRPIYRKPTRPPLDDLSSDDDQQETTFIHRSTDPLLLNNTMDH